MKKYNLTFLPNFENHILEKTNDFWESLSHLNEDRVKEIQEDFIKLTDDKQSFNQLIEEIKAGYKRILKIHYNTTILYYCNLISHNHNNLSRYPEPDFNPLKYYNLKNPLIKKLPAFITLLKSALKQLKRWNEEFGPA